ncbi:S9 family peptidase [Myxococcus xanthus]|uniref:S9 family peptidase n=1 Tax=Myxococcus xanthus TaxID=34 RepID=UPI0020A3A9D1|nr:prolyl oligopeptidase family serine peptidase [Myxococcus xanthus]
MKATSVRGASFSADEQRVLYSSNETGVFNVFSVPMTGGKPTQLTRSTQDASIAVAYFPTDDRVLFTRDSGGNELAHLSVRTLDGQEKDLTPGDEHRASFFGWSRDGAAFYVLTNERDARFQDLYRYDAKTYARTLLYAGDGEHVPGALSPDEKWLALEKSRTLSDSDVHLYEFATQQRRNLTAHEGSASWKAATFDPASSALYLLTNEGSEFIRVERHVLASGKRELVEQLEWDVLSTEFSRRGLWRITRVNEDGRTTIRVHDVKAGRRVSLPGIPEGAISGVSLSRGEKRMAFHVDGDRSPGNLYVYDFETKKLTRLTDTLGQALPPHKEALREALYQELGNPQTQEAMLREISPLFHAEKIRSPLLVIQGANDPRVPKAKTDALVEAVRKNGVPVDYLVLPNDGHGFSSTKSEAETSVRILSFLDQHLRQRP